MIRNHLAQMAEYRGSGKREKHRAEEEYERQKKAKKDEIRLAEKAIKDKEHSEKLSHWLEARKNRRLQREEEEKRQRVERLERRAKIRQGIPLG